jgi:hypothetical protein
MIVAPVSARPSRIEQLSASDDLAVERFLAVRSEATLYHSPRYRDLLHAVVGGRPEYLGAWRNGNLVGFFPAFERDGAVGKVINSLPFFGSYGGAIAEDEDCASALWSEFAARAERHAVAAATVVGNPFGEAAVAARIPTCMVEHRIGQITVLQPGTGFAEHLRASMAGSARRNLRKARIAGVRVVVRNRAVDFLAHAHYADMAGAGRLVKPAAFFAAFPEILRPEEDYRLYLAELDGEPVAALLMFYFKETAEYIMPAIARGRRALEATAQILFQAMLDAADEGRRIWNWGGTRLDQTGVYRFKRKWGAVDRPYEYAVWIRDQRLLDRDAGELAAAYPWFYVAPYTALRGKRAVEA